MDRQFVCRVLLFGLALTACTTNKKLPPMTPANIEAEFARVAKVGHNDPLRPGFHLTPVTGFMADPDGGIYHKGWHHLFYMHQPFQAQPAGGGFYWGHVRSKDLVNWEHLPPNLTPPTEREVWVMFSGSSIISPEGIPMVFYSAPMEKGVEQMRAVGNADMTEWTHGDPNPVLSLKHPGVPSFDRSWRDPFVFEEAGRYFMILYAERSGEAEVLIPIFEAEDKALTQWKYKGILFKERRRLVNALEVPDLRKIGDKWVLTVSSDGQLDRAHWYIGNFDLETLAFTPVSHGLLDHSSHFYAQESIPGAQPDDVFMIGWFPGWDRDWMPNHRASKIKNTGSTWNGCFTLPRHMAIADDNHLIQTPVKALEQLRETPYAWKGPRTLPAKGTGYEVLEVRGNQFELITAWTLGNAAYAGINVLANKDGKGGLSIMWSGDKVFLDDISVPMPEWKDGDPLHLQIFVDHAYVEVFINHGRHTFSRKLTADQIAGDHVALTRGGGAVTVQSLQAWSLRSIAPLR